MILEIEHISVPRSGETLNGDGVVVRREAKVSLFAVIDALGHGARAAEVSTRAIEVLRECSLDAGALAVIDELDRALRGSRGACALVCLVDDDMLEGCSVGNVEMRASGVQVPFVLTPGVLGARVRKPRVFGATLTRRARLVAYSDGVSAKFHLDSFAEFSTSAACRAIFEQHRRAHDDATLLVADIDIKAPR